MIPAIKQIPNRVLVVDDDEMLLTEYIRCLGEDFEPDDAATTLSDLEKVLFGEDKDAEGKPRFNVDTQNQGEAAVIAVENAVKSGNPYAIVFLDITMPPGIDGIEAAKRIRKIDKDINIVIVTGTSSPELDNLDKEIPPADRIFYFKKPFHAVECRQLAAALCGKWHSDMALRKVNEDLEQRVEERTAALHKLAYFDPVTRLPNHWLMLDRLQEAVDASEDLEGDTVLVMLDVDRFSFLNETMGYDAGTELLRAIGNRLKRTFREEAKGNPALVGRVGSDEFCVIFRGIEGDVAIRELAEAVKETVEEPFLIRARDIFLKASVGVAWHPVHGRDAKTVVRCADAALHRSKRSPDNNITYYHSEMRYRARHKFDLEAEFRGALEQGQIQPYYQPQQSLKSGDLAGVEALARWIRPDGTVVPPSDFVPLSEEMGVSDKLFESILTQVCKDVAQWRKAGDWDVPVAVNMSAHQLRNADIVSVIKQILLVQNIDRKLINLELTETALLEDLTVARPVLKDLNALGVGIHIDDFGTGYSSLSYLAQLPVQTLKIDQTFTRNLAESETNGRVVQSIIALGQAMGLDVVAEGVETDQQYGMLRKLRCDLAQGFFIAKPMPAEKFTEWRHGHVDTQSLKHGSRVVDIEKARQ
ncbi:MAG: EAL domain-containing protein [Pseudomonadota bacterium]